MKKIGEPGYHFGEQIRSTFVGYDPGSGQRFHMFMSPLFHDVQAFKIVQGSPIEKPFRIPFHVRNESAAALMVRCAEPCINATDRGN